MRMTAIFICLVSACTATSCISTFLYYPTKEIHFTPVQADMQYEDVSYTDSLGNKINGWWVPAQGAEYTILLCHGNGGNIHHRIGQIKALNVDGFNVFIFDYAGYGLSQGTPSEAVLYDDAHGAWSYLTIQRKVRPSKVIVWGTSLGGSVAAWLASKKTPRALVLESSFFSLADVVSHHVSLYPAKWCLGDSYATFKYLAGVQCPVLVIHSKEDMTVPFAHGVNLFKIAPGQKRFIEIQGSHNKGYFLSRDLVSAGLKAFIAETTDKEYSK